MAQTVSYDAAGMGPPSVRGSMWCDLRSGRGDCSIARPIAFAVPRRLVSLEQSVSSTDGPFVGSSLGVHPKVWAAQRKGPDELSPFLLVDRMLFLQSAITVEHDRAYRIEQPLFRLSAGFSPSAFSSAFFAFRSGARQPERWQQGLLGRRRGGRHQPAVRSDKQRDSSKTANKPNFFINLSIG